MKNNLIAATVNILLCLLLLGDAFLFPRKVKLVSVTDFSAKYTHTKGSAYYNYFMFTSDGSKYEITAGLYDNLKTHDTVGIFSSCIMRMPLAINYRQDGQSYTAKIGQLNSKESERYGLYISLILSTVAVLALFNKTAKQSKVISAFFILAFATSFVVFLFVLIEILSL